MEQRNPEEFRQSKNPEEFTRRNRPEELTNCNNPDDLNFREHCCDNVKNRNMTKLKKIFFFSKILSKTKKNFSTYREKLKIFCFITLVMIHRHVTRNVGGGGGRC